MSRIKDLRESPVALCAHVNKDLGTCQKPSAPGSTTCTFHVATSVGRQSKYGLYSKNIDSSLQLILAEVINQGKYEDLKITDLEDELIISRLQLMSLMQDANARPVIRMKAIETVARIAKTAKLVKEVDANALRQDFLNSVLTAISYSFQRANSLQDPAERARTFIAEMAEFFPAVDNRAQVIEGHLLNMPDDDENDIPEDL
jgi:hypothetical protein